MALLISFLPIIEFFSLLAPTMVSLFILFGSFVNEDIKGVDIHGGDNPYPRAGHFSLNHFLTVFDRMPLILPVMSFPTPFLTVNTLTLL